MSWRQRVQHGVAAFSHGGDGAHLAQAVGYALSHPSRSLEPCGKIARVELSRQPLLQQAAQVGGRGKVVSGYDFCEALVFNLKVALRPPPALAAAGIAPLFNVDQ